MTSKLIQNIKHSSEYNSGGITEIYLLDFNDFIAYEFVNGKPFNECLVERIKTKKDAKYIQLDTVNEANFTESYTDGIFRQEIKTFVRSLYSTKTENLLYATASKYLILFRTSQGRLFAFGSDEGVSLSFSQQTGKLGEVAGYNIVLNKSSIYPLFEANPQTINSVDILATEDLRAITTEDGRYILI